MTGLDWTVLIGTLGLIIAWGLWRTRGTQTADGFLRGHNEDKWYTVGLAVMATQASAITFLSTPGQAYEDGLRFIQFYFGMPIAMVVLSVTFVPAYFRMRVTTAYEFLEARFDLPTRLLAAFLFLVQRGLSTGITIYAPAIVLSKVLGWPLQATNVAIGAAVIAYTVCGGTRAVSQTQKHQMVVMLGGMIAAAFLVASHLPEGVGLVDTLRLAGALDKVNAVDLSFDPTTRYTLWSGLAGGFFLAMSYFGTDHSQVQRYLSGRSITESRLGLLFNGLLKIPMQFLILFVGLLVFTFHAFECPPVFFNESELTAVRQGPYASDLARLEDDWTHRFAVRRTAAEAFLATARAGDAAATEQARAALRAADASARAVRADTKALIARASPGAELKDQDYIFIGFVLGHFPRGLVGLLIAVFLCAAMSSTASELTSLGSTTLVDFHKRLAPKVGAGLGDLRLARLYTALWGIAAVLFAAFASLVDNLIQAVNILGSLFYGTILGIFLVALYARRVRGRAVFLASLAAQATVIVVFLGSDLGFLWYNVVGCAVVVFLALTVERLSPRGGPAEGA